MTSVMSKRVKPEFHKSGTVNVNEIMSNNRGLADFGPSGLDLLNSANRQSPSFNRGNLRPPSTSTNNPNERIEYLNSQITVEKFDP